MGQYSGERGKVGAEGVGHQGPPYLVKVRGKQVKGGEDGSIGPQMVVSHDCLVVYRVPDVDVGLVVGFGHRGVQIHKVRGNALGVGFRIDTLGVWEGRQGGHGPQAAVVVPGPRGKASATRTSAGGRGGGLSLVCDLGDVRQRGPPFSPA